MFPKEQLEQGREIRVIIGRIVHRLFKMYDNLLKYAQQYQ